MGRATRSMLLATLLVLAGTSLAHAEPQVAPFDTGDGMLTLVGTGWRPAQKLVITLGRDVFPVQADSLGEFEMRTGLPADAAQTENLSVRRTDESFATPHVAPPPAPPDAPSPLGVLFAQAIASGIVWLGAGCAALAVPVAAVRVMRRRF